MSSLGSGCALSQKHTVGSNYLLLAKARMSGNKYGNQFWTEMLTKNRIRARGTQSMWFSMYSQGKVQLVQEANPHLALVSTLPLLEEQWRPRTPSSWQSTCAGSSWRKAEWTGTGTLLGPQTNTWTQEKSRRVTLKLRPGSGAAVPNTPYRLLQSAFLWVEAIKCLLIVISLITGML